MKSLAALVASWRYMLLRLRLNSWCWGPALYALDTWRIDLRLLCGTQGRV
jgi:hypothetical protein